MDKSFILNTFFKSKKNANCVLDLERSLLSEDDKSVSTSISIVMDLFTEIFNRDMLQINPKLGENEKKYTTWLINRYKDFVSHLLCYLCHESEIFQAKSLEALMTFVTLESQKPIESLPKHELYFAKELFESVINQMASPDIDQKILIMMFEEYALYDDVKMYLMKSLLNVFNQVQKVTDIFLLNCFYLLTVFDYPEEKYSDILITRLSQNGVPPIPFHLKPKVFSKQFSCAWIQYLKFKLPPCVLKKVLVILRKKIIPHLQNPCLLTDFLTDAYKKGGLISLLSLNGLFFLMDKYNVEYPDFFIQLYSLFDESIVNGKFSARFFYLGDLFLSSTHLPSYTVAAFAKRLSRIALSSRTDIILKIIPFVCNLLIRHPTLECLIHRIEPAEISKDPYDFNTVDPAKSNALESSLWEIKSLERHVNPDVSKKAKLINHTLPSIEYDSSIILNETMDNLFKRERKRKFVGAPLVIQKSRKLGNWWIL